VLITHLRPSDLGPPYRPFGFNGRASGRDKSPLFIIKAVPIFLAVVAVKRNKERSFLFLLGW